MRILLSGPCYRRSLWGSRGQRQRNKDGRNSCIETIMYLDCAFYLFSLLKEKINPLRTKRKYISPKLNKTRNDLFVSPRVIPLSIYTFLNWASLTFTGLSYEEVPHFKMSKVNSVIIFITVLVVKLNYTTWWHCFPLLQTSKHPWTFNVPCPRPPLPNPPSPGEHVFTGMRSPPHSLFLPLASRK